MAAAVCRAGRRGDLGVLTDPSVPPVLAGRTQTSPSAGQFLFWPRATAPDVLPQKQFKGEGIVSKLSFLWKMFESLSLVSLLLSVCVCTAENKGQFCFCFLHLLLV